MKKNNTIDFAAWGLVLVILLATPFIVNLFHTPPELGPDKNPTVLIMFLTLLGFIALTTLGLWGQLFMGRTRSISAKNSLPSGTLNTMNLHNKLVGGLFIVSGFVKLQDPMGFSYKLDDYWAVFAEYTGGVFPGEFFMELSVPLAIIISVFEVVLAFAMMTGFKMRLTSTLVLLMIVFFTFLTGFSAITGAVTDCGCFGDALKLTPMQSFLKDVLLTFSVLPPFLMRKRIHPYYRKPVPLVLVGLSAVGFGYLSIHTLNHLPCFDFRGAYKVGQSLKYNTLEGVDEDGLPIAHDFYEFVKECGGGDGFEGATLYIVAYYMDEHPKEEYEKAVALKRELDKVAPGIKVATGTNTSSSVRRELGIEGLDELCFSGQDEKTLKTMVRSSPGYLFMKDGVIIQKWHYNDIPSAEELKTMAGDYAIPPPPPPAPVIPDSLLPDSLRVDSLNLDSVDPG